MSELEELRFPVGHFTAPAVSTPEMRAEQIETIRQLPAHLRRAIAGLNEKQFDTPYREGGWTVRQVVHHLADSHANSYVRCKLALTEEWPTIKPYDEGAWARLPDNALPAQVSVQFLEGLHARWTALLESLTEAEFQRGYRHPDSGPLPLSTVVALYAWHSRHHTAHITHLRHRMGW